VVIPKPYYQDSHVTLYCGDCRQILPELGKFDLLLTDPPYLLPNMKGGGRFGKEASLTGTQGFTDAGCDHSFLNAFDNWFCFCSKAQLPVLVNMAAAAKRWNLLTWCKTNPVPTCNNKYLPDVEFILHKFESGRLFGDFADKSSFFLYPVGDKDTKHPNEKPVKLICKLITLGTKEGETICDPFAGSGTTGVAAKLEGRKAVLIELEERFCEVSAERLRQGVLF